MSGETEDMTAEVNSVESGLIWTDNPELAYFRSMMKNRIDERMASGLDTNDSLIGESIIRDMLDFGDDDASNSTRNDSLPLGRLGVRDTSGLSDAENDTVDNIYIEDGSILAVNKSANRALLEDGTLESQDNEEGVPATRGTAHHQDQIQIASQHSHHQSNNQDISHPAPLPFQRYSAGDDVAVTKTKKYPGNIPGIIFVTGGHSSIIETRIDEQSDDNVKKDDKDYRGKKKKKWVLRSLIIFLAVFVMAVATIVAVLLSRNKLNLSSSKSSSSSSSSLPGPTYESTISGPQSSPTFAPSSLRASYRPTRAASEAPTSNPITDDLETTMLETSSAIETGIPTFQSTRAATPVPSVASSIPLTASPTRSTSLSPSEEEVNIPSESPSVSSAVPTTYSPKETSNSLTSPPSISATIAALTDQPTFFSTASTSQAATTVNTKRLEDPSTCTSTISTHKTCYENGETMEIIFNNCDPKAEDWIGIFPAWMDVSSLRQPLTWVWACGNQFCNIPVLSGIAKLYQVQGFGGFRIFLLRDDPTNDAGFSASAVGNEFRISTDCD